MRQELDQVDRLTVQLFEKMDFSQVKQQEIILSVLWFSAQPCKRLLTYCNW